MAKSACLRLMIVYQVDDNYICLRLSNHNEVMRYSN
jgi:hypothetical protein